jgi:predicted TIM-barrel enzyme
MPVTVNRMKLTVPKAARPQGVCVWLACRPSARPGIQVFLIDGRQMRGRTSPSLLGYDAAELIVLDLLENSVPMEAALANRVS